MPDLDNRQPAHIVRERPFAEEEDLRELLLKLGKSGEKDQFWSIINMFDELNSNGVGAALLTAAIEQKWDPAIVKWLVNFQPKFFDWTIRNDPFNRPGPLNTAAASDETHDIFKTILESGKLPLTFRDPRDCGRTPMHAACRARAYWVFDRMLDEDEI